MLQTRLYAMRRLAKLDVTSDADLEGHLVPLGADMTSTSSRGFSCSEASLSICPIFQARRSHMQLAAPMYMNPAKI